jgi:predicted nucleic acid-binding protein
MADGRFQVCQINRIYKKTMIIKFKSIKHYFAQEIVQEIVGHIKARSKKFINDQRSSIFCIFVLVSWQLIVLR